MNFQKNEYFNTTGCLLSIATAHLLCFQLLAPLADRPKRNVGSCGNKKRDLVLHCFHLYAINDVDLTDAERKNERTKKINRKKV